MKHNQKDQKINLQGRSFLAVKDFSSEELKYLLQLSHQVKRAKKTGQEDKRLVGKNLALIFQKDSTRTRCSFEIAAADQGANTVYLGPTGSHMGTKESIIDTAKVLGALFDGIEYRGFAHQIVEDLASYSGVPVWNGLTDKWHPTQMIGDFMTIEENFAKPLEQLVFAYFGDARNNMAHSYVIMAAKMGMELRIVAPESLWPEKAIQQLANMICQETGGKIIYLEDALTGAAGANIIATDVWVSMGESKAVWKERIALLKPYQVTMAIMRQAANDAIFLHCLPAFHDDQTKVAQEMIAQFPFIKEGMEVTNEVFNQPFNKAFAEAENRMHSIKAIMVATLG